MGRPCFFRLHETRVRESVWMVDPSIDPREKKKKFKWGPISRKDEASTIQPVYFESLGLTLNVHVPPSVASRVNDKPAEFDKMSPEALALDFEHVLRDLKDMETFYRERKEK